jgi:hypothetical protein
MVLMIYCDMQCQLREFVCTDPAMALAYADEGGVDEVAFGRAWPNEEVEITDNSVSHVCTWRWA